MPFAISRGVKIYWEEHGTGPPVLLIMGLTFALDMWHRVLPSVARNYRAILLDNRGVGRSDSPGGPYWIPTMAEHAGRYGDGRGRERTRNGRIDGWHDRAGTGAASPGARAVADARLHECGGLRSKWPDLRRIPRFGPGNGMTPEERTRALIPLLYAPATPPERIDEDTRVRLRSYPQAQVYWKQFTGIVAWNPTAVCPESRRPR